jgi:hypothetical protein
MRDVPVGVVVGSVAFALIAVSFAAAGCIQQQPGGVALYYPAQPRRPTEKVARLYGHIASVDDRNVASLGKSFDIEPGCHVIVTRADLVQIESKGMAAPHDAKEQTFALPMEPAHSYVIELRQTDLDGQTGKFWIQARETLPDGSHKLWNPADTQQLATCKAMRLAAGQR